MEREDETVAKRALREPVIVMRMFRAKHPDLDRNGVCGKIQEMLFLYLWN